MALRVERIPTLRDNYTYLLVCEKTGEAAVVDAPEAGPVFRHVSDAKRIPGFTSGLEEGDTVTVGSERAHVLFIPAHTRGHIAYAFDDAVFCGDTLFAAGCGRLFEGTPA